MTEIEDLLDGEKIIGGIKMRPFTVGSRSACKQMGLSVFTEGKTDISEDEANKQIIAFAWLHSAPLKEVLQRLRNGTAEEAAMEFGFNIEPFALSQIVEEINRISKRATENSVEVISRNGVSKEDAPGNS